MQSEPCSTNWTYSASKKKPSFALPRIMVASPPGTPTPPLTYPCAGARAASGKVESGNPFTSKHPGSLSPVQPVPLRSAESIGTPPCLTSVALNHPVNRRWMALAWSPCLRARKSRIARSIGTTLITATKVANRAP